MMKAMVKKILTLGFALFFLLGQSSALAQIKNTDLVLQIYPKYPSPGENVQAILSSTATDLTKAYISWSVNNQNLSGGIGKTSFSFNTSEDAYSFEVAAGVNTADGQNITSTLKVIPTAIDLLWEAQDSYVPPFYKGKALVSKEGTYKVVALPSVMNDGKRVNNNNLSYMWKKDDKAQQEKSGWGKSFFIFKNSYIDRTNQLTVQVSDVHGAINTVKSITLQPTTPKIVFYRVDPVLGMQGERALSDGFKIKKEGETIAGIPYFINEKNLASSNLDFTWKVGQQEIFTTNPRNQVTLIPPNGKSGIASVSLNVENSKNFFEGVAKLLTVDF